MKPSRIVLLVAMVLALLLIACSRQQAVQPGGSMTPTPSQTQTTEQADSIDASLPDFEDGESEELGSDIDELENLADFDV